MGQNEILACGAVASIFFRVNSWDRSVLLVAPMWKVFSFEALGIVSELDLGETHISKAFGDKFKYLDGKLLNSLI